MRKFTLTAVSAVLLANSSFAATVVVEDFSEGAGDWSSNTIQTNTDTVDGVLVTDNSGGNQSFGAIGAQAKGDAYSGPLESGVWTASVDLSMKSEGFDEALLRWRYKDATYNGWYYAVESKDFSSDWKSYSVTFDTTWDDATAKANGWVQEDSSVSFSTLWSDIYWSEVRLTGAANTNLSAGIDNYSLTRAVSNEPAPIPLPSSFLLLGCGTACLLATRRIR